MSDGNPLGPFSGHVRRAGEAMRSLVADAEETETFKKNLGVTKLANMDRSPHFDLSHTVGEPIYRGYLTVSDDDPGQRWRFYFLFNPKEVSYDFAVTDDLLHTDFQADEGVEVLGFIQGASVSFSLFLDRTHELAQSRKPNPNESLPDVAVQSHSIWSPQRIGIMHDIAVFNKVVAGGFEFATNSPGILAKARKVKLVMSPGGSKGLGRVTAGQGLNFEGFITSTNVAFHKFTPDMVPMQGVLNVSLRRTYEDQGSTTTSAPPREDNVDPDNAQDPSAPSVAERILGPSPVDNLPPLFGPSSPNSTQSPRYTEEARRHKGG